jgi:hypothetical protein
MFLQTFTKPILTLNNRTNAPFVNAFKPQPVPKGPLVIQTRREKQAFTLAKAIPYEKQQRNHC